MLSRRALVGGAFAALSLAGLGLAAAPEPTVLDAVMRRMVAGSPDPDALGSAEAAERYIAALPWWLQAQVRGLLRAVQLMPIAAYHARFTALPPESQDAFLDGLGSSPRALERQMLAALKQLCAMGHYQQAAVWAEMGYPGPLVGR